MQDDTLVASNPETWSTLHFVAVAGGVFEDTVDGEPHTCDCSPNVDVASCCRVFPDNVLLGARLNLSLTRLRLKLGVDIALRRVVFIFCLFRLTPEDVAVG